MGIDEEVLDFGGSSGFPTIRGRLIAIGRSSVGPLALSVLVSISGVVKLKLTIHSLNGYCKLVYGKLSDG